MPQIIPSGSIIDYASAAGGAQGRASVPGPLQSFLAAVQPGMNLMLHRADQDRQRKKHKEENAKVLDDMLAKFPEMKDHPEVSYLYGLRDAGVEPADFAKGVFQYHTLMSHREAVARSNQRSYDEKFGYTAPGPDPTGPEGEQLPGPGAPIHVPGQFETSRANAATRADASRYGTDVRAGTSMYGTDVRAGTAANAEAGRGDRFGQTMDWRNTLVAQSGERIGETARHNKAMEDRPSGARPPTEQDTELKQIELDHKEAQAHTRDMRGWYFGLRRQKEAGQTVDENQLLVAERAWRSAMTAERETATLHRSAIGNAGDAQRGGAVPAVDRITSTKQAFSAKHHRDPDPNNPDDVAEMKSLYGGSNP